MADPHAAPPSPRVVRVFVSSTFRDMQQERDELVKRVFPRLRRLCEQRGVVWGEVDLRWGVTDEQAAEGRVLPICLAEIRRCRPYFIGLLGERYGWVPDEIPTELAAQEPWLAQHLGHSVTELEILHGVLNDPEMAGHAFFYFRSPSYIDSLPVEEQPWHREPTPEETARYGAAEAHRRAREKRRKLESLKERIRAGGLPVREIYPTPQVLGELVLDDLTAVIDRLYPEGSEPDPLDREAAEHEAFARSRAGVYIGGERYFARLDAYAEGDGLPLVVQGESGLGKSALLANWALRYRDRIPGAPAVVLTHFIGAAPHSADWASMLRRLMRELQRRLGVEGTIPDQPDALRAAFANWLGMASVRGRVVLVLDGLNQLEDRDQAPDLVWLPPTIPANVRLLLSTLPGRPLDALAKRGWPALEVQPLALGERRRLIVDYLAQYTKALGQERAERLAAAPQCANPLYLRALLEELRLYGVHERLDERIGQTLAAGSVGQLYEKILERYEEDYERDRPGLVGEAMSLLWAARRGLSEAELLDLLGSEARPLPRAHWSPLYLAAEASLVDRSGLLGFLHDYLRQAVERRYVPSAEAQRAVHLRLADYFHGRGVLDTRRVDEEAWQLAQARAWERLYALLAGLPFFNAAWQADPFQVKAYWAQLEAGSPLRMVAAYREVLSAPGAHDSGTLWRLAQLLTDTGHPAEALSLNEFLVERNRASGDRANLAASLGNQALNLHRRGELDAAMALYKEQERLCRELGDKDGLQSSLGNQGLIFYARDDLDTALALHKEVERLCREIGSTDGLSAALGNQANILYARGDLDGALALHREEERLCRETGNKQGLRASLGNQALILHACGDPAGAAALHRQVDQLCRDLGDKDGLWRSLNNEAQLLYEAGNLEAAMALLEEQEALCRELGDREGLAACLGNQALIHQARRDLDRALELLEQQERLCRELGNRDGLRASLENQLAIHSARGDLASAVPVLQDQERLCRELGDDEGLATALANQAFILGLSMNQPRLALSLADEAHRLALASGGAALVRQIESIRAKIRSRL